MRKELQRKRGKMLRVAICDDDLKFTGQIEALVFQESQKLGIRVETEVFSDGKTLLNSIQNGEHYQLIFIDIEMEQVDGITAARCIREIDRTVLLIYVSGYDKYMMELFRLDVFGFIKKPIDEEILTKTFLETYQRVCSKMVYFTFSYKHEEYKILCKEILYFESNARKVTIYTQNGEHYTFNGKLSEIEQKMSDGKIPFLRVHQSYLVNYYLIRSRTKIEITLVNGKKLPISEERQKYFNQQYSHLLGGEINV